MNDSDPVFVNILVTSPSEDTYSIYTLRLSYNNFFTPKYSLFQMLICILLLGSVLFVIGFFAAIFWIKRKTRLKTDTTLDSNEVMNDVEKENMPTV